MSLRPVIGCLIALTCFGGGPPAAAGVEIDSAMLLDPLIPAAREVNVFPAGIKPLWLQVLRSPEADMRRRAAEAIAEAHRRGMPDLLDTIPALIETLEAPGQHSIVRLAAAGALIALDARQAAAVLRKHAADGGLDMAQLIEPALARWQDEPIRADWLARLDDEHALPRELLLAIDGLGQAREERAAAGLLRLASDRNGRPDLRLRSATALGTVKAEGLEQESERLAASPAKLVDRLVAASLLMRHSGPRAEALLLKLSADPEPAVAAIALRRLLEIDHRLVAPATLDGLLASPDANVRRLAAGFLVAYRTPEAVGQLTRLLDDEIPDVRQGTADDLVGLAASEALAAPVCKEAEGMLAGDRPRGIEQAALVLGTLKYSPVAERLVELLEYRDAKVRVAAAWALRRLALPSTAAAILAKAEADTNTTVELERQLGLAMQSPPSTVAKPAVVWPDDLSALYRQSEQLLQALGILGYRPADPLLRRFFPKPPQFAPGMPPQVETLKQERLRAAALWALGQLPKDEEDQELEQKLAERLDDMASPVESPLVRRMAAASLGRMQAKSALAHLERFRDRATTAPAIADACTWAIHRLQGTPPPTFAPWAIEVRQSDWFLEPLP